MQPSHYGKAAPFVEQVYAAVPPEEVAAFFASLGLMTAVEDGPRLSPHDGRLRRARRAHGL